MASAGLGHSDNSGTATAAATTADSHCRRGWLAPELLVADAW
jgi:hypothetical protein